MDISRTPSPFDHGHATSDESNRSTEESSLKSWTAGSVWSLVCATELGLVTEPSAQNAVSDRFSNDTPTINSDGSRYNAEVRTFESFWPFPDNARSTSTSQKARRRKITKKTRRTKPRRPKARKSSQVVTKIRKSSPTVAQNSGESIVENKCGSTQSTYAAGESQYSARSMQKTSGPALSRIQRSSVKNIDYSEVSFEAEELRSSLDNGIDSDEDFVDLVKSESSADMYRSSSCSWRDSSKQGVRNVDSRVPSIVASSTPRIRTPEHFQTIVCKVDPLCPSEEEEDEGFGGDTTTSSDLENSRLRSDTCSANSSSESVKADGVDREVKRIIRRRQRSKNDHREAPQILPKELEPFHDLRRITRGSTRINKENFVGKLVWGSCSGWWPALIIDGEHVGMISETGKLWVYWIGESRISLLNEKTQIEPFSANLQSRLKQKCILEAKTRAVDVTMQMLRDRFECVLTKPYHAWMDKNLTKLHKLNEMKFYPYPAKIKARLDQLKEINAKVTEKYVRTQKNTPELSKKQNAEKVKESVANADPEHLPLMAQKPGVIAWAKIAGHNWWPAMILDYRDCCMRVPSFGCQWIMWYGDYQLSEVHHRLFLRFHKGLKKMRDYTLNTKKHLYLLAVLHASQDYYSRLQYNTDDWSLADVFQRMSQINNADALDDAAESTNHKPKYEKYSVQIMNKLNEVKLNSSIDEKRKRDIKSSDALRMVTTGEIDLQKLCLRCLNISDTQMEEHPFFKGSLCRECLDIFAPCVFVVGNDGKCFYCTVCVNSGTVVVCDREKCPRVYCTACLKYLLCPKAYKDILLEDPWECFLCNDEQKLLSGGLLTPQSDSKERIVRLFRTSPRHPSMNIMEKCNGEKKRIRVLSLFDGLSTGLLVLQKLGISVEVYYASEIDRDALMVSFSHFGDEVIHLGDVRGVTKKTIMDIAPIDLLIGGSPCNDLSLANPARLGLHDPNGTGILFFDYCRIKELVKKANKDHYLFWLYENVASMPTEYRLEINRHLGQEPDIIDSADFSPQHRLRLYWHNLPVEPSSLLFQDQQDVQDILTPHCNRYALVKKIQTVTTKVNSLKQGKLALKPILMKDESDSLWITELEEIFGFPRHYTDVKNLSATKRQRLIGKSWSVQTLTAIFRPLCSFFESE